MPSFLRRSRLLQLLLPLFIRLLGLLLLFQKDLLPLCLALLPLCPALLPLCPALLPLCLALLLLFLALLLTFPGSVKPGEEIGPRELTLVDCLFQLLILFKAQILSEL